MRIYDKSQLIEQVVNRYEYNDAELSEDHFVGLSLYEISKAEFMEAYAEIQKRCNGDTVVSIVDGKPSDKLVIPEDFSTSICMGINANMLLEVIHRMNLFVRKSQDGELLDLIFGPYNPE